MFYLNKIDKYIDKKNMSIVLHTKKIKKIETDEIHFAWAYTNWNA